MRYKTYVAAPDSAKGVYNTVQALENIIKSINDLDKSTGSYEQIVSAFPLGNVAVVITETLYI